VRRAFQPVTVVVADEGEGIAIFGVNDTPHEWRGELRFGIFALAGGLPADETHGAILPANSAMRLAHLNKPEPRSHGAFALLRDEDGIKAQSRLLLARFRDLRLARPEVQIESREGNAIFTSPAFVWGATLDVDGEAALQDNCFDLLPGIPYEVAWRPGGSPPTVLRTGNQLLAVVTR
jgi:hypothetical protein